MRGYFEGPELCYHHIRLATIEKIFVLDTTYIRATNNSEMFPRNLARSRVLLLINCVSIVAAGKYPYLSE
jgi:hypothetical protein